MKSTIVCVLCFLAAVAIGCYNVPTIGAADDAMVDLLKEYEGLAREHRLQLAAETEPGDRLIILGRLIRKEDEKPIAHHLITIYQADGSGSYDESVRGLESTARLTGVVQTDSQGRFLVSTVLPGDYGSTANNRHIHTTVVGARPEAYDFYFLQYINRGLLRWANQSNQAVVLDVRKHGEVLLATADLAVLRYEAGITTAEPAR